MNEYTVTNDFAVREVRSTFYNCCNPSALTNRDLLILLLEPLVQDRSVSVLVDQLLEKGISTLSDMSEFELGMLLGLNERQSLPLMALFEFSRRVNNTQSLDRSIIRSPQDAYEHVKDLKDYDREHFVILHLNTKNKVIGRETISIGSLDRAVVHPREVFKSAIRRGSAAIIAAHNHPSGDSSPSHEDIQLTERLQEAGELVGIELLDHIIIGTFSNTSLKERGLMKIGSSSEGISA